MLALGERPEGAWQPPIVKTVAHRGEGLDEVVEEIDKHRAWLGESGELAAAPDPPGARRDRDHRRDRAAPALGRRPRPVELDDLAAAVVAGESDPYTAADTLLENL